MSRKISSQLAGLLCSACAAPALWVASPALAADAPATARAVEVEQLIVTAERRETRLQDTPIAVTALSGTVIENARIVTFLDVALAVPNLTYTQFSTQESYFSIRGSLINNNAAGYDEAVSTFIDDVPATGLGDNDPDLFDLHSIEVLRGPQGTLFGRNVTGGAVVIRTLPPSRMFGGKAQLTYGSDNLEEFRGLITGPITDSLAGKLSASLRRRDDFERNVSLGGKVSGVEQGDVRGQLLWTVNPDLNVLLGADYLHETSSGYATKVLGNFRPSVFPNLSYDPSTTNQGYNGENDRKIGGAMGRVTWNVPWGVFTSITGYRTVDDHFPNSVLGDPSNQLLTTGIVRDRQWTQEFHLASPADRKLSWVAGVFLLHANKREGGPLDFNFNPATAVSQFVPVQTYHQGVDQSVKTDSYAAFGEATWAFTESWKLIVGGRESYERKAGHSTITYSVVDPGLPPGEARYSHSWDAFTPRVTLQYQPTPRFMAYLTAANGFKSGGYDTSGSNGTSTPDVNALLATPFQPEYVWNYELGEKVSLFDNRLTIDADIFFTRSRDLQTQQLVRANSGGLVQVTTNAARAETAGVEIEAVAAPTDWLNLGATYAYMDAHFADFPGLNGNTPNTGNRIPYSPRNQLHLTADLHFPAPQLGGKLEFGGDYTYHSRVFFDHANSAPDYLQHASAWRGIVNLYANYLTDDGAWKLQVWGKNVTDRRPVLHAADVGVLFQSLGELFSGADSLFLVKYYPARTVGVTLTRNF